MASVVPELPVLARDQAFETLYRRYVRDVYYYALALLRNPADAEDVTQTTFLNAYRAYKRGDEIRKPQNWLIKIAHNVARTRYARASRRVKEVPLEEHVERLAVPEDERPNVEGVLRALGRLPFNQRAAIVMRELEGRSYAEIADTLGVSVSAVEALIFRARRSLRLRGSAIRVLTVVPLPGTLAQLFEGGAVVAGGGAIVGTGFLAKAMVVLVAGAVATGVGGDKTNPAAAAAEPAARVSVAPTQPAGNGLVTRNLPSSDKAQLAAAPDVRRGEVTTAQENNPAAVISDGKARGSTAPTAVATSSSSPAATAQVVATVSSVVSTVENAAPPAVPLPVPAPSLPTPSLPAPSLPAPSLPAPSLPTIPVEVPPVPPLPHLP
jgi:RNA polymerase sigma factor (sigma-70 family)